MDYGLIIEGVVMGDVEAKPEGTGVPGILAQDERYSRGYSAGMTALAAVAVITATPGDHDGDNSGGNGDRMI